MTSTKFEITSIEIRDRSTGAGKIWLQVTGMDRESSDRHIKDQLTRHFERSQRLIDSAFGTMRAAEKHLQECREMFSDDVSGDEDEEV